MPGAFSDGAVWIATSALFQRRLREVEVKLLTSDADGDIGTEGSRKGDAATGAQAEVAAGRARPVQRKGGA